MSGKPITEKVYVLAVLENDSLKNAYRIRNELERGFDLKPRLNTLRKNLQRCYDQGLVKHTKISGSYHYKISKKGRERLRLMRAKRQERCEEHVISQRSPRAPMVEKFKEKELFDRVIEVTSAIELCDIVLRLSSNSTTRNFARSTKAYWNLELFKLVPYMTERIVKIVEQISKQSAKAIERMLSRARI